MSASAATALSLQEGRFARFEAIQWWDQGLVQKARLLVIGAGALGNEVLKNLALLGVGHVIVADQDRVELSNLSRSVLFRESDEGRPKAECAARAMREIYPAANVMPFVGNILADLGLGAFRWADVVVGALDNREARVFTNSACARTGRPWMDGGIEVMQGIVRGFAPPQTACYECTMSQTDWDLLNKRRSCSLLARRAIAERGVPTTPTSASVIGALQAQEVVKILHGMDALLGRGWFFDGAHHQSSTVAYLVHPDCPWHEAAAPIETLPSHGLDSSLDELVAIATTHLGGFEAFDFSRELVESSECAVCGKVTDVWRSAEHVAEHDLRCASCGTEGSPRFVHSLAANSPHLGRKVRELGLPAWDILWARHGEKTIGFELAADALVPAAVAA